MLTFSQWLEETGAAPAPSATTTGSIAPVPMRVLSDNGRPFIGVPGRPSPYDKKKRPTIIRREFSNNNTEIDKFDYPWMSDLYGKENQIIRKKNS